MKPSIVLILTLLIGGGSFVSLASAQTPSHLDSIAPQLRSSNDTVQAIHRLFLTKRRSATAITLSGIGVAGSGVLFAQLSFAIINSVKKANGARPVDENLTAVSVKMSLPGLFVTTLGAIKRARFNRRKEESVIDTYQQGQG